MLVSLGNTEKAAEYQHPVEKRKAASLCARGSLSAIARGAPRPRRNHLGVEFLKEFMEDGIALVVRRLRHFSVSLSNREVRPGDHVKDAASFVVLNRLHPHAARYVVALDRHESMGVDPDIPCASVGGNEIS